MLITGDLGVREMSQSKIKVITLITGIGAQEAALKRLNIPFEVVGISEIDKYAIQSYNAINGPMFNYGDITKIPMLDYADLWTYSFPCQDLSVAGKQAGISEGTRSGLLLHVERLIETAVLIGNQPKYLLLENVKALVSKKFKPDFDRWLQKLESLGYNNYWQVLNAKDYGVPQNRERVFVVSIRKDVDTKGYKFPEKIPLTRKLKDVLEPVVDEKYYLSQDKVDKLVMNIPDTSYCIDANYYKGSTLRNYEEKHRRQLVCTPCVCASRGRNPENPSDRTAGVPTEQRLEVNQTGCSNTLTSVQKDNYLLEPLHIKEATQRGRIYSPNGCSPALNTTQGGGLEPKIVEETRVINPLKNKTNYGWHFEQQVYDENGITRAIKSGEGSGNIPKVIINYRIRKLTPLECWRLMDFTDEEFYTAQLSGVSNSQLYKQAGNSIVVAVLQAIFKELLA